MERKKRALILVGAGASLEFGSPSTTKLTKDIKTRVCADEWMQVCGGDHAYLQISQALAGYLEGGERAVNFEGERAVNFEGECAVNFEHVYHCARELLFTFEPIPEAVNEYRPILVPFISRRIAVEQEALRALAERMVEFIFAEISAVCEKPTTSLNPLAAFLAKLREHYITRLYTTNYDDFLLQSAPGLYTGFDSTPSPDAKGFDGQEFWQKTDADCVFHLHGSVHLGFGRSQTRDADLGTLHWFDDRAEALRYASYGGSGERRMDGSQTLRTAVITGLDKLSYLQHQPFSHYYASLARDAMVADIIYVIGSGLSDLHLNARLRDARRKNPKPPLIFVDYWPNSFLEYTAFATQPNRKRLEMLHALRMLVDYEYYGGDSHGSGWTLAKDRTCAIWDKGFLAFLRALGKLDDVLAELIGS